MIKAGGILAIIAGLLGLVAGVVTLVMGGLGEALSSDRAGLAVGMGWGGILFSLLVVVYGAISLAKPRAGAVGLALSAIAGIVLGGMLVAVLLMLVLVAAVMVWLGRNKTAAADIPVANKHGRGMAVAAMIPVLAAVLVGGKVFGSKDGAAASDAQIAYIGQTTNFHGYEALEFSGQVLALYRDGSPVDALREGDLGVVVLDETPFYAESGGQVGDRGLLQGAQGIFAVEDTQKIQAAVFGIYVVCKAKCQCLDKCRLFRRAKLKLAVVSKYTNIIKSNYIYK